MFKRLLVVIVSAVVAGSGVLTFQHFHQGSKPILNFGYAISGSIAVHPGTSVSWGTSLMRVRSPITLRQVILPKESRGLVLGVGAVNVDRAKITDEMDRGFPVKGVTLRPVDGFQVRPGQTIQIVVGLRSDKVGTYTIPSYRISFESGGKPHTETVPIGVTMCDALGDLSAVGCKAP